MADYAKHLYSPEEYLELERAAGFKSEYLNGEIYAMAGSSPEHSAITFNVNLAVGAQLRGTPCQGFSSDMKVRTSPTGLFGYPDLSIVCGEPQFHDAARDVLINPKVIVEVLSPSTEAFDRGRKFVQYQHLTTFTDYLLISQDEPQIDHFARYGDQQWLLTIVRGVEASLSLPSISCTLLLSEVYDRIAFPSR